jgi:hypothetical protein
VVFNGEHMGELWRNCTLVVSQSEDLTPREVDFGHVIDYDETDEENLQIVTVKVVHNDPG